MRTVTLKGNLTPHAYDMGKWILRSVDQSWLKNAEAARVFVKTSSYSKTSHSADEPILRGELVIDIGPFRFMYWLHTPTSLEATGSLMINFRDEPRFVENVARHDVKFSQWPIVAAEIFQEFIDHLNDNKNFWKNHHGTPKAEQVRLELIGGQNLATEVQQDDFQLEPVQSGDIFSRTPAVSVTGQLSDFSDEMLDRAIDLALKLKFSALGNHAKIEVTMNAEFNSIEAKIDFGLCYLYLDWSFRRDTTGFVTLNGANAERPDLETLSRTDLHSYDEIVTTALALLAEDGPLEVKSIFEDLLTLAKAVKAVRKEMGNN